MTKRSWEIKDNTVKYILTRPEPLSALNLDELNDIHDSNWRERARQLQVRRWRKLRQQSA